MPPDAEEPQNDDGLPETPRDIPQHSNPVLCDVCERLCRMETTIAQTEDDPRFVDGNAVHCWPFHEHPSHLITEWFTHLDDPEQLRQNAITGSCFLCWWIWDGLPQFTQDAVEEFFSVKENPSGKLFDESLLRIYYRWHLKPKEENSEIKYHGLLFSIPEPVQEASDSEDANHHLEDYVVMINFEFIHWKSPDALDCMKKLQEAEPAGHSTLDRSSLELAAHWITDCISDHKPCETGVSSYTPTRLVDIGDNEQSLIRIWDTSRMNDSSIESQGLTYLTLSYCWGVEVHLSLKTANYDTLCQGFSFEMLPKTFKDAVTFMRLMNRDHGFNWRHIWIDSLCIIQDDVEDWNRESTRMKDTYANAFINLAAADSEDAEGGLARHRPGSFIRSTVLRLKPTVTSSTTHIPVDAGFYDVKPDKDSFWHTSIISSILGHRGWVLQECLLAQRVLYFAHTKLYFECASSRASEVAPFNHEPAPFNPELDIYRSIGDYGINLLGSIKGTPAMSEMGIMRLWTFVVERYSNRSLSRSSDRPVAIAGIAEKLSAVLTGYVYCAGLWVGPDKEHVLHQLVWEVITPKAEIPERVAPSWSWQSVLATVNLWFSGRVAARYIGMSKILYATDSCYGKVKHAEILMHGVLIPCTVSYIDTPQHKGWEAVPQFRDGPDAQKLQWTPDTTRGDWRRVFMVLVRYSERNHGEVSGLVVEKMEEKGQFRRIGMFSDKLGLDGQHVLLRNIMENGLQLEEDCYIELLEEELLQQSAKRTEEDGDASEAVYSENGDESLEAMYRKDSNESSKPDIEDDGDDDYSDDVSRGSSRGGYRLMLKHKFLLV